MQTYAQMKNSGVEWLGDIPEEWEQKHTKYLFSQVKESVGSDPSQYELLSLTLRGIIPRSQVEGGKNPENYDTYQVVYDNDLVMCLFDYDVTPRTVGRATQTGMVTGAYTNLRPLSGVSSRYYNYFFLSLDTTKELLHLCTGLRNGLSKPTFFTLNLPVPDYKTQKRIADYLDTETALTDDLIAKQQHLLELLEEKRRATITHAVTGSAYKKVALKMILQIPLTDGPHETPTLVDDGVPFVSAEACSSGKVNFDKVRGYITREEHERFSKKTLPQKNDIFIIKSGATTGTVALVDTDREFNIWSPLALVRVNESYAYYKFVYYALTSREFLHQIETNWSYGTQQNIGMGILKDLKLSLPDVNTQKKIADRLESELIKIEELGQKIQAQITLLRERRTSLISHAVTGKVKV